MLHKPVGLCPRNPQEFRYLLAAKEKRFNFGVALSFHVFCHSKTLLTSHVYDVTVFVYWINSFIGYTIR